MMRSYLLSYYRTFYNSPIFESSALSNLAVSPSQKSIDFRIGHTWLYAHALLKIFAGFKLPGTCMNLSMPYEFHEGVYAKFVGSRQFVQNSSMAWIITMPSL